jgi:hypothetical protein
MTTITTDQSGIVDLGFDVNAGRVARYRGCSQ